MSSESVRCRLIGFLALSQAACLFPSDLMCSPPDGIASSAGAISVTSDSILGPFSSEMRPAGVTKDNPPADIVFGVDIACDSPDTKDRCLLVNVHTTGEARTDVVLSIPSSEARAVSLLDPPLDKEFGYEHEGTAGWVRFNEVTGDHVDLTFEVEFDSLQTHISGEVMVYNISREEICSAS